MRGSERGRPRGSELACYSTVNAENRNPISTQNVAACLLSATFLCRKGKGCGCHSLREPRRGTPKGPVRGVVHDGRGNQARYAHRGGEPDAHVARLEALGARLGALDKPQALRVLEDVIGRGRVQGELEQLPRRVEDVQDTYFQQELAEGERGPSARARGARLDRGLAHGPDDLVVPLVVCEQRPHGLGGAQHVLYQVSTALRSAPLLALDGLAALERLVVLPCELGELGWAPPLGNRGSWSVDKVVICEGAIGCLQGSFEARARWC
mmetsp:Transcript_44014/g.99448  ORF Transcript_44014/g.99448 Transcript_44014/m.99448 type:complete len:267 (-) Transcript_44014:264-1064(-)